MGVVFLLFLPLLFSVTPALANPASTRSTRVNQKGSDFE